MDELPYLQLVLHVPHLRHNVLILHYFPIQQTQLASEIRLQQEKHVVTVQLDKVNSRRPG